MNGFSTRGYSFRNATALTAALFAGVSFIAECSFMCNASVISQMPLVTSQDFTVVYRISVHDKLADLTPIQLSSKEQQSLTVLNRFLTSMHQPQAPASFVQSASDQISGEVKSLSTLDNTIMVISQRNNLLLVKMYSLNTKQVRIFDYDGSRTLATVRGSDAQIFSGFQYGHLSEFCFPGIGVAGIPILQNLGTTPNPDGSYSASVAQQDGVADVNGLPEYDPGKIQISLVNNQTVVTETSSGYTGQNVQQCIYSGYRGLKNGLIVPARIKVAESYEPAKLLPFDMYCALQYSLVKAVPQALPASQFAFESQLTNAGIVQDNTGKKSAAIVYTPGLALSQQFAVQKVNDADAHLGQLPTASTHPVAGVFGALALAFAFVAWYIYLRKVGALR